MAETEKSQYLLGKIQSEAERLHRQHLWVQACLNNRIVFAPIDLQKPGLKVLDVGCADGSLLRDLQKQVAPSAELVGLDLTSSFLPVSAEGNIRYGVANVCDAPAPELVEAFDLTHLRYVLVGCGPVGLDTPIGNLAATLAPGAWLQVQELDATLNETTQGPAFRDLLRILGAIWNKVGPGVDCVNHIADAFTKAGLQNVHVQKLELPVGRKLDKEQDRLNSMEPFKLTIPNITRGAKALGTGLPDSVFDGLEDRFEREMLDQGAIFHSVMVYGQKPQ
ncbi:hypothetical protein NQ176_g1615 [Zarea fungicola]|uniref:Uncharacterized protein n=1 Tax=Zarea fungicola TaxID=93591 RepID=A0ACC1NRZ3_9HYPO|nr:hypothetical protein NQ176_g1615 [Lecanicillium fungicola]